MNFKEFLAAGKEQLSAAGIDPLDAEQSMPSAHTSLALTSMLHLSKFLMENNMTIIAVIPLSVSLLVAKSRVKDRYHDWLDISVGMLIGLASTLL